MALAISTFCNILPIVVRTLGRDRLLLQITRSEDSKPTNMKVAVIIVAFIALASASPKGKLNFRNLYKEPIAPVLAKPGPRIIGGQEATPHSRPFQVFLTIYDNSGGWYCGGSLISRSYILTAGHCGDGAVEADAVLGAHRPQSNEDTQVRVTSTSITVHENYDGNEIINDISVIQLSQAVTLTDAIQTIALPTNANSDYAGETARVSGWGLTDGHGTTISPVLRFVDVQIISQAQCEQIFGRLDASVICTSGNQNTGTCSGDSGGPLTVGNTQVGVVSFGVQYCPAGYPSAYARLTVFISWLARHTDVKFDI